MDSKSRPKYSFINITEIIHFNPTLIEKGKSEMWGSNLATVLRGQTTTKLKQWHGQSVFSYQYRLAYTTKVPLLLSIKKHVLCTVLDFKWKTAINHWKNKLPGNCSRVLNVWISQSDLISPLNSNLFVPQVEEIREMVDNDLGFQQVETKCPSQTKTFLFISSDKKVAGCLIAEHIQEVRYGLTVSSVSNVYDVNQKR